MKICHINLAKGFRGGERQTVLLIRALATKGVDQALMARADSPMLAELRDVAGLELVRVRKPYIKYLLKGMCADIVQAHEAKAAQWAMLNKLRTGTPYAVIRRVPNKLSSNSFTRSVYSRSASIIAVSEAVRDSMKTHTGSRDIPVVPDMCANFFVNQAKILELKKQYAGKFVIGHLGALVNKHKGQYYLIEAARIIQRKYPDIHFLLLGEGYDRQALQSQAEGLSNLEFMGYQQDVGNWLSLFDVFAYPSLEEGLGSSLLDAMQAKVPIVASRVGGIPDIIQHEENGILVPPGDSQALADQIIRLYQNAALREHLVAAGALAVQQYKPDVIADRYLSLYQSTLSTHSI